MRVMEEEIEASGLRALVLGSGPAGLFAAEACVQSGFETAIISKSREPSVIGGAQFLHQHVPGVTRERPDGTLRFILRGERSGYAQKVYGRPDAPVSFEYYEDGDYPAWDLRDAYSTLWGRHAGRVVPVGLSPHMLRATLEEWKPDFVANTVPRKAICWSNVADPNEQTSCTFTDQEVAVVPTAMVGGENVIVYNGNENPAWYRSANIFGRGSTEWSMIIGKKPPVDDVRIIRKPLHTTCRCWPNLLHVGRYGKWDKHILSDDGYFGTIEEIKRVHHLGTAEMESMV